MEIAYGHFLEYLLRDKFVVDLFCAQEKVELQEVIPNLEEFPINGLMYFFNNNLGGYSLEGLLGSLLLKQKEI